jgi:hypothetical protein
MSSKPISHTYWLLCIICAAATVFVIAVSSFSHVAHEDAAIVTLLAIAAFLALFAWIFKPQRTPVSIALTNFVLIAFVSRWLARSYAPEFDLDDELPHYPLCWESLSHTHQLLVLGQAVSLISHGHRFAETDQHSLLDLCTEISKADELLPEIERSPLLTAWRMILHTACVLLPTSSPSRA